MRRLWRLAELVFLRWLVKCAEDRQLVTRVVRCGVCVHGKDSPSHGEDYVCCDVWNTNIGKGYGYCYLGERR